MARKSNIPPRTMQDVSKEHAKARGPQAVIKIGSRLKSLGKAFSKSMNDVDEHIKSGDYNGNPISFDYGFNTRRPVVRKPQGGSWDGKINVHEPTNCPKIDPTYCKPGLEIIADEPFESANGLTIPLQMRGVSLTDLFQQGLEDTTWYAPANFRGKKGFMVLQTVGDMLTAEIVPKKAGEYIMAQGEVYCEALSRYNPLSMRTQVNNGIITVTYEK